jgi:16S rRNA pseudouridine516 synthase
MRLDKFLVDCGLGSRTEVKNLLKKKLITVNGKVESSPKRQIDENSDVITYQGNKVIYEKYLYYLLNKPKGVISATEDNFHKTVLDLLDTSARAKKVFPVGRLDIDTHGLLLLTNNGALAHAMLSPKKHVEKIYQASIAGIMTSTDVKAFKDGIELKDFTCQPAQLNIVRINNEEKTSLVTIVIKEGKFHQVKRMVQSCGKTVTDLKRVSMGPLHLEESLELGEWRQLTSDEMKSLEVFGVEL